MSCWVIVGPTPNAPTQDLPRPNCQHTHLLNQDRHRKLILGQASTLSGQPGPVVPLTGPHCTDTGPRSGPGRALWVTGCPIWPTLGRDRGLLLPLAAAIAAVTAAMVAIAVLCCMCVVAVAVGGSVHGVGVTVA